MGESFYQPLERKPSPDAGTDADALRKTIERQKEDIEAVKAAWIQNIQQLDEAFKLTNAVPAKSPEEYKVEMLARELSGYWKKNLLKADFLDGDIDELKEEVG